MQTMHSVSESCLCSFLQLRTGQMHLWRGECGSVQAFSGLLTECQTTETHAVQSFAELRSRLLFNFQRVAKNSLSG